MPKNPKSGQDKAPGGKWKPKKLGITWEFEPSPDAQERLLRAFEMLFEGVPEEQPPQLPEKKQGRLFSLEKPSWSIRRK